MEKYATVEILYPTGKRVTFNHIALGTNFKFGTDAQYCHFCDKDGLWHFVQGAIVTVDEETPKDAEFASEEAVP